MERTEVKRIINIAIKTGRIMLEKGAETYRVEDTVQRMMDSRGLDRINVFVIPTGILISADHLGETLTILERVQSIGIDLESISRTNDFSRKFTQNQITLDEAEAQLIALNNPPMFSRVIRTFASGMGGGFFIFLFGGGFIEFILAYFASALTIFFTYSLDSKQLNFFIRNMIGGFLASIFGVLSILTVRFFGFDASLNMVIIGPLMTLVPGVSLTNGIRDLISGELLAGSAKMMEALFIAIALAFGVGMVLQFSLKLL